MTTDFGCLKVADQLGADWVGPLGYINIYGCNVLLGEQDCKGERWRSPVPGQGCNPSAMVAGSPRILIEGNSTAGYTRVIPILTDGVAYA